MNFARVALASLGAIFAYFAAGFALFAALPGMKAEFLRFPGVFRSEDEMKKSMPVNMVGILVSIVVLAVVYAKMYPLGGGVVSGGGVGALMGVFAVCTFALHNYAFLRISGKLTVYEGATYFIQWVIVGAVIGLIYKPM
jgi:hypothetical protein